MDRNEIDRSIQPMVSDFKTFIDFFNRENPILTRKKSVLGKKDAYRLNALLQNKRDVPAPNYLQNQYFCLDVLFGIAVSGQLYLQQEEQDRKIRLVPTSRLTSYLGLNDYEQYVFLLETYLKFQLFQRSASHTRAGFSERTKDSFLYLLECIAQSRKGDEMTINGPTGIPYRVVSLFTYCPEPIHHLQFFGMFHYTANQPEKVLEKGHFSAMCPTPFGISVCKTLLEHDLINQMKMESSLCPYLHDTFPVWDDLPEDFHQVLARIFPTGLVNQAIEEPTPQRIEGVFLFKVSLSGSIWRTIRLAHWHFLDDLHDAIQSAFEFDRDHLYAFYLGGNHRSGHAVNCSIFKEGTDGLYTDEVTIGNLKIFPGQKMYYLFDFGDMWEFEIALVSIDPAAPLPERPEVVEFHGTPPEQYPTCEEYEEFF